MAKSDRSEWSAGSAWWSLSIALLLGGSSGCAAPGYSPCPLDLSSLPDDAFARCRAVLLRHFGSLAQADQDGFRLQTAWQPTHKPPGERRATVFRDEDREHSLAIVVESRRLTVPLIGPPGWTDARGDMAAERELAEWLRQALTDPH